MGTCRGPTGHPSPGLPRLVPVANSRVLATPSILPWTYAAHSAVSAVGSPTSYLAASPHGHIVVSSGCPTKHRGLGGLTNRLSSSRSGGRKSKIKALAGSVSPEVSLLSVRVVTVSPRPHLAVICVRKALVSLCVSKCRLLKGASQIGVWLALDLMLI